MTAVVGIETSCDETAAAVVVDGRDIRSNIISSQVDLHAKFGGVVPEIASRAHLEQINAIIQQALDVAGARPDDIDALAVTHHPGLIGCLLIGVTTAKTLAWLWNKPLVAVDHIQAHAWSAALAADQSPWPAVALVVSGGHTSILLVRDDVTYETLGATTDDAAGEAFDKVAAILELGYPGGPIIDRLAKQGDPRRFDFPRSWLEPDSLDFSFSGIKTAVLYQVHGHGRTTGGLARLSRQDIADVAASFQTAVIDVLVTKTLQAAQRTGVATVVAGGGVVANTALRTELARQCQQQGLALHLCPREYCMDNGVMIAGLGYHRFRRGLLADLTLPASA
jgi:N6-L-threonylcarbamoyladenine synthase